MRMLGGRKYHNLRVVSLDEVIVAELHMGRKLLGLRED
jgi:hypothetical protein